MPTFNYPRRVEVTEGGAGVAVPAILAALAAAAVAGPALAVIASALDALAPLAWVIAIFGGAVTAGITGLFVAALIATKRIERELARGGRTLAGLGKTGQPQPQPQRGPLAIGAPAPLAIEAPDPRGRVRGADPSRQPQEAGKRAGGLA